MSNTPVERESSRPTIDGTRRSTSPPRPRMSTYITALCAGPYHEVRRQPRRHRPRRLRPGQSMAQYLDVDDLFLITTQGFDFFHEQFGVRYPLPKYDQLWVPDFNAGAMENFGCVTHAESHYIFRSQVTDFEYEQRANTILHELAHMWFGDLVTMRWWNDLWLNESFAEWASHWCNTARHPVHRRLDDLPVRSARTGATGRTSSPPPTRSTARCRTWRRSRSTSTASRTPRAPASSSSSSRTSGIEPFLAGLRAYFAQARLGQRHLRRPAHRAGGGLRPGAAQVRRAVAGDRPGQHAAPARSTIGADGTYDRR